MQPSRSLAIATGVTLAAAGAVSALFLTVGAGASILAPTGDDSPSGDSTTSTTGSVSTTIDDLSNVEIYTLDDNGQLVPMDSSGLHDVSSATSVRNDSSEGSDQRSGLDDSGYGDDGYEGSDDGGHHEDDDRYEVDDD